MIFEDIGKQTVTFFEKYYQKKGICICDKTFTCKKIWKQFHSKFTEINGCLIIKNNTEFWGTAFDFPLASENGDLEKAVIAIENYCMENGLPLKYCSLNGEEQAYLAERYSYFSCSNHRSYRDYIFLANELSQLKGKKYAGQRNHINKFISKYPDAYFKKLTSKDKADILIFLDKWEKSVLVNKNDNAKKEFILIKDLVKECSIDDYIVGGVEYKGELISFCLGEKAFDTVVLHIEKALHEYEGVNIFMIREYAKICNLTYINREDDASEEGLRTAKMQLHPYKIVPEYLMTVNTEAIALKSVPTVHSERLIMNSIKKKDIPKYYRLCSDDSINKFWGYDYRTDLKGELYEGYFYEVAKADFKNRLCINFAIRERGEFIGETVIYDFDYRGGCKVGVRILPEKNNNGYGKEAFLATIKYALYELGVARVYSSCYKQNIPSLKMHEQLMRRIGQDEEKNYYMREY